MRCRRDLVGRNSHIDDVAVSDWHYLAYLLVAIVLPVLFLMLRRGSVQAGLYSFVAWNTVAIGFFCGVRRIAPIANGSIRRGDHQALNNRRVRVADIGEIRA